jgi:macrolide transport system ATP-binding/permease protein
MDSDLPLMSVTAFSDAVGDSIARERFVVLLLSAFGDRDRDDVVFVPVLTAGMRLFGRNTLDSMTVVVEDESFIGATEEALTSLLLQRHGAQDFNVMNAAEIMSMVSQSRQTFTVLLGSIAAISLLVGGIGVMNIMLVSVTERTREIGIRMATGARQTDILSQFLVEAIVVSVLGGLIGLALGVAAGLVVASFDTPVSFTATPMLLAFGCAAATGLVFGFAPARKAAKLDPVVALASE